ncbi:MAG: universal stress protein [bacterium]
MAADAAPLFGRILYVVSEKLDDKQLVTDLARAGNSAVLLCALIDPDADCDDRPARLTDGMTRRRVRLEEQERQCWLDVYAVEEEFRSLGIRASVVARSTTFENIQALASSTGCDLLVLPASVLPAEDRPFPGNLLGNLPCPVLVTPSS